MTDQLTEEEATSGDAPSPAPAKHPFLRATGWIAAGIVALVLLGVFVTWRSLTAIDRLPFNQSEARERLEDVPDDQVEELSADLEAAEIAAIEAEEDQGAGVVVDDQDLLGGARSALPAGEITDEFVVPYSNGDPVDDSVYDSYLLIGSDLSGALADVIIYVLQPKDGGPPIMVSLPRDLYLPNPCTRGNTRLNAALNGCGDFANGPELLGLMVEDFTGIPVDHFATVDFGGFTQVIDAFGGIEICVVNPVRDRKAFLSLEAGCTQADGETVLAWVRSRRTEELIDGRWQTVEGVSDFSRQQNQQDVLLEIAGKLRSFSSITGFGEVVAGLQDSVTFDEGLDFASLVDTAWDLRDLDLGTIDRVEIGVENKIVTRGGLTAYVLVPTMTFQDALMGSSIALEEPGGS